MSMSRKQYRDIAEVIRGAVTGNHPLLQDRMLKYADVTAGPSGDDASSVIYNIACGLAAVFVIDNPRFDRQRFMTACNIDEEDILRHR